MQKNARFILLIILVFQGIHSFETKGKIYATPLDDYIATPDVNYSYSLVQTISQFGYTGYVVEMTSQTWRTPAEVDRTEWKHWVTIVVPSFVWRETAALVIAGADNGDHRNDLDVLSCYSRK